VGRGGRGTGHVSSCPIRAVSERLLLLVVGAVRGDGGGECEERGGAAQHRGDVHFDSGRACRKLRELETTVRFLLWEDGVLLILDRCLGSSRRMECVVRGRVSLQGRLTQ